MNDLVRRFAKIFAADGAITQQFRESFHFALHLVVVESREQGFLCGEKKPAKVIYSRTLLSDIIQFALGEISSPSEFRQLVTTRTEKRQGWIEKRAFELLNCGTDRIRRDDDLSNWTCQLADKKPCDICTLNREALWQRLTVPVVVLLENSNALRSNIEDCLNHRVAYLMNCCGKFVHR